jgi:DNA repair exonuclease SbcCD ATPase subunit
MKISFRGLVLQNYASFNGAHSLNLGELAVGMHYVSGENRIDKELGSNDAGKSTLFNALCWCLYGRTSNDLRSTDIKPWKEGNEGKTKVGVIAKFNGKRVQITRTAPGAIEIDSKEAGQQDIDKLMGMSYDVFKHTVLFGQEEGLFFDLPNREKLGLLGDVLELDKWDLRSAKAGERTRELESMVAVLEANVNQYKDALVRARSHIVLEKKASAKFAGELAAGIKRLKDEREELLGRVKEAEKAAKSAKNIANNAASRLGDAQAEESIARQKVNDLHQKRAVAAERAASYEREARALQKELNELGNNDVCPTCGQSIKGTDLRKHMDQLKKSIEIAERNILANKPKPDKDLALYQNQLAESRVRQANLDAEVAGAKRKTEAAEREAMKAQADHSMINRQIAEAGKAKNPHIITLIRLKAEARDIKAKLAKAIDDKATTIMKANRARYWIKGFKDVRLFVIEEVLEELELVTNAILEDMGMMGWQVKYDVERETKKGTVQTGLIVAIMSPRNKKPVKWAVWGGGARQRLRLAGALALSEVLLNRAGVEVDLEILDEPTKHMTEGGVEAVCTMLAERAKALGRRILYVDHMAREGAVFESTITIRKTSAGSAIADN